MNSEKGLVLLFWYFVLVFYAFFKSLNVYIFCSLFHLNFTILK